MLASSKSGLIESGPAQIIDDILRTLRIDITRLTDAWSRGRTRSRSINSLVSPSNPPWRNPEDGELYLSRPRLATGEEL